MRGLVTPRARSPWKRRAQSALRSWRSACAVSLGDTQGPAGSAQATHAAGNADLSLPLAGCIAAHQQRLGRTRRADVARTCGDGPVSPGCPGRSPRDRCATRTNERQGQGIVRSCAIANARCQGGTFAPHLNLRGVRLCCVTGPALRQRAMHPAILSRILQPPSLWSRCGRHESSALDERPLPVRPTKGVQQQIVAAHGGSIPWAEFWRLALLEHGPPPSNGRRSLRAMRIRLIDLDQVRFASRTGFSHRAGEHGGGAQR